MRWPLLPEGVALRNRALEDVARLRSLFITVCAWCGCVLRAQDVTDECVGVSHGLCSRCDARMEAFYDA